MRLTPDDAPLVAVVVLGVAVLVTAALVARGTPGDGPVPAALAPGDFTPDEVDRGRALHRALRPPRLIGGLVGALVPLALGFTSLGSDLVGRLGRSLGGGWPATSAASAAALVLLIVALGLPTAAYAETVLRRFGISVRRWGGWWLDVAKSAAIETLIAAGASAGAFGVVRATGRWWWLYAAVAGAGLVVLFAFVMPVVLEPIFNRFTPMADTPLRDALFELAARSRVRVAAVLVADASRRTTAMNAYVSGLGATRRIVVFDTTLSSASPRDVELVVAHELGHARHRDVVRLTVLGSLGVALAMPLVDLLLRWHALCRWVGVVGSSGRIEALPAADPRVLPLATALLLVLGAIATPWLRTVSRRIEARADGHALDLTGDPEGFAAMQRGLALANRAYLTPSRLAVLLRATHPPTGARIAAAREWARSHGQPEPGPLAPEPANR